jgi:hypothetical protein
MRAGLLALVTFAALGGCSVMTERSSLGYGDYVALSCDALGAEAVRLMGVVSDRSEHLLRDDEERRDRAKGQLKLIKQASIAKKC